MNREKFVKLSKVIKLFVLIVAAFIIPMLAKGNDYYLHVYIICVINTILASSLRSIAKTGQVSIGQGGFMAVGAYTSAILAVKFNIPVYWAMLSGGLASMMLAALIGFPLSRIKTVYFVMITMFLSEIIRLVVLEWRTVTGGSTGLESIPRPAAFSLLGIIQVDFSNKFYFCYLALFMLLVILLILYNIDRSHSGTVLSAIGQEEYLSSSLGINVARYKVLILCIGCFFTGLAGALYAHYMTVLNPDAFSFVVSLYILIYVIVGGKMFTGPIAGAVLLTLIPELFSALKEYQPFVFVLVLFLVVFLLPGGLMDLPSQIESRIRRIFSKGQSYV
ncbi:MAG: branched-chain amino acid ABC transporter permease [Deltaproteobacteria bacterium]|nr:branched-chain amino acid ABC transporter permease [Deltaproteobacteria bacterium]